jgi:hypothetical protein
MLAIVAVAWSQPAFAQTSAIPVLNSRPGAAYTLYLNFGGFNFGPGTWGGNWSNFTPGNTPAYTIDGSSNFSAAEVTNMREIWSRAAEKYAPFNVNVTTVDPAAAGSTDNQRRTFYDSQARMMHMVIGGNGAWTGGAAGISFQDVADATYVNNPGSHTNFTFSAVYNNGTILKGIAETVGHENGHALILSHQSRWNGGILEEEYDPGTPPGQPPGATPRAPIMGNSDFADRGLWRVGATPTSSSPTAQNDIGVLMTNNGFAYADSGIGHTRPTATTLPMNGTAIDFNAAKGVIAPVSVTNPNPLGEANYTTDFFRIVIGAGGASVNVTLRSGRNDSGLFNDGTADLGATLDAIFRVLDVNGAVVQSVNGGVFSETITVSNLPEGTYYFQISSAGADVAYFDVGSYFLVGSIVPVPEPGLLLLAGAAALGLRSVTRRQRAAVA